MGLDHCILAILIENFLETASSEPFLDGFCVLGTSIEDREGFFGFDIGLEEDSPHIIGGFFG